MTGMASFEEIGLDQIRRCFAEEIRVACNIRSDALVEAFASVPRERFLGPGPWMIRGIDADLTGAQAYPTPNADPRHVYHNVSVALDLSRQLFNGQPGTIGLWIDALQLKPGDRVLHVGCASGYYTAIIAQIVEPQGRVTAIEIDADLARRAAENLAPLNWVEVRAGDGTRELPGVVDAILINAGATHPLPVWFAALGNGGRMVLPLTFSVDSMPSNISKGLVLLVTRNQDAYAARFFSAVAIYSCIGSRDAAMNERLRTAMTKGTWTGVKQVRLDAHEPSPACWLHGADLCLSA
jgi:protein-L-isoaspartate(D-aspartate) O-methyltransferase